MDLAFSLALCMSLTDFDVSAKDTEFPKPLIPIESKRSNDTNVAKWDLF